MQAQHAAGIKTFYKHSAYRKLATHAAVTTVAQAAPSRTSKVTPTATKTTLIFRSNKGTATPVKKGKGKAVDVGDEDGSMARISDAATVAQVTPTEASKAHSAAASEPGCNPTNHPQGHHATTSVLPIRRFAFI